MLKLFKKYFGYQNNLLVLTKQNNCLHVFTIKKGRLIMSSLFIFMLLLTIQSSAQNTSKQKIITITGVVTDSTGRELQGVSVINKAKKNSGTFTDTHGKYVLDVTPGSPITFSYVGYTDQQTIASDTMHVLNIVLKAVASNISDVVVTAFGRKERREAVVGSVTTINPAELKIPASNLTNALAGKVAGVIAYQRSGQPGFDNSNFFVRGVTTNGYSANPLILVDNIELSANDLARLQVDDIASFSILKDASAAALYGARGANGVILITTKEGKIGKASINLRVESSISKPTKNLKLSDPITYMNEYNEAVTTRFPLQTPAFTPNQILNTKGTLSHAPGSSPYIYPAVDWMKTLFKSQTTTDRANFSANGGSQFAKYYIAGSYSRDNGILEVNPINNFNSGIKFENYQLRANVNFAVTPTTNVEVRLWGNFNDYTGPITSNSDGFATDLYSKALHTSPVAFPAYYLPDSANLLTKHILFGNNTSVNGNLLDNPYADLMRGYKNSSESRLSAQFELNQKLDFITKGLSFKGIFSTNRYSYFDITRQYAPFYYDISSFNPHTNEYVLNWINSEPGQAREFLDYSAGPKTVTSYIYLQGTLDYSRTFDKHNIGATLIGTREQTQYGDAGDLLGSLPYRNLGISGRASYSYDNRYFVEFNFGYNGSERFAEEHRFGFFPTIGAGWVISNEKFWQGGIADIITRLKIRGSYGMVGNDNIGSQRFFYLSNVSPDGGPGASFGTSNGFSLNGTTITAYPNPDITWEKSRKSNLALEMTLLKRLNITAEIYHEYRYDILNSRGYIPVTAGFETSAAANLLANIGKVSSQGLDLNLDYKQNFTKDFWAQAMGNLTITSNKLIYDEEPDYRYAYQFGYGLPLNQPRGYIAERLFVDDKEAQNSPDQSFGGTIPVMGGDIKYRDVNGDGVIDADDQVPIGLPTVPQIIYGFGFSVGYKSFDLSLFFQGLARESFFIDQNATAPFINNSQLLQEYANDHWTEENQNLYALWPRLSPVEIPNNNQNSTWWLRDGSFLRLKSAEVGYTLPTKWTKHAAIKNLRIYFSGLNLLTLSSFKMWDPELSGNGFSYPVQKVFNLGINMNF